MTDGLTRALGTPAGAALLSPAAVTSRHEALSRPSPVPAESGVYAWYFDVLPPGLPADGVLRAEFGYLLYVGIAPRAPRRTDGRPSVQNLRKRIRNHFRGNASGSTLRKSLGALLSSELGIKLQSVGRSERLTFGDGEAVLSAWMEEHARVCWFVDAEPWLIEEELIAGLVLPLNLSGNRHGSFYAELSQARDVQRRAARAAGDPRRQ